MKKYLITVYANNGEIYKTLYDDEKAALEAFENQLDYKLKTLKEYGRKNDIIDYIEQQEIKKQHIISLMEEEN